MKRTRSSARASDSSIAVAVDVQEVVRSSVPSKRIRGGGGVTAAAAEGGGAPRRAAAVTSQSTPAPTTPRTTNNEEVQIAIPAGAQSNLRNTTFSAPSAGHVSNPSARGHTALARALQDAEYTFSSKGIAAFRDVMNKMPLRKGLSDSNSRAVYWITWLRAELSAGQWEHIEDVIQRATEAVPSEGRSRRSKEPRHRPDSDSEASVLEAALLSIRRAAGELRTKQEEEVHELLETRYAHRHDTLPSLFT